MSTSRFSTIPGAPAGHPSSVSITSLTLALRESQLENDRLAETIRELKDKVAELQAEKAARKRGRKGRSSKNAAPAGSDDEGQVDDPETKITSLAKRFCILHRPWVPEASFGQQPPKPSSDPSYFGSREQWTLGSSAEIYEVVPSELHHLLSTARISSVFRSAVGAQRVAMAHSLKTCAPRIFAKIDIPESAFTSATTRAESGQLQALLKWNVNKPGFPTLAPILYEPHSGRDRPFQNPVLPLILRVILFGPSSLTSRPAANSSGRKWEVSQVTIGGICLSAVMARFLISEDTELSRVGSTTNIDYEEAFHAYHSHICRRTQHIQ
ncbi:hypothetical protein CCMSSC00406_0009504 [Pleurotus cornucopiae]|uniref:Uncharacterized protein n=2 Tax=Pleurotus cornucopiae TaxID=5321 RepID=A0ACB7IQJ7_PLECO|nr:hypothetical protein CCMSSC00406_0010338 [Pleurotus cornucopiae]KAG9219901.1 hypothetical protein CCMSSC00406_0009504 [Pleurotus cornucopiae]